MTESPGLVRGTQLSSEIPMALVWIDSREAIIVRLREHGGSLERIRSGVPPHRRATGHIRHDPVMRHGGGSAQTAGEPHRLEHLHRFIDQVVERIAQDTDLTVIGPGTTREHLARRLRMLARTEGQHRHIAGEAAGRLTDRQLVARLRQLVGAGPRRRTVGAYRWSEALSERPSGRAMLAPRRVNEKPARRPHRDGSRAASQRLEAA